MFLIFSDIKFINWTSIFYLFVVVGPVEIVARVIFGTNLTNSVRMSSYKVWLLLYNIHGHLGEVGFWHLFFPAHYFAPISTFKKGMGFELSCTTFSAESFARIFLQ
jgi:hypothetical protein